MSNLKAVPVAMAIFLLLNTGNLMADSFSNTGSSQANKLDNNNGLPLYPIDSEITSENNPNPLFIDSGNCYDTLNVKSTLWNLEIHKDFAEKYTYTLELKNQMNDYLTHKAINSCMDNLEIERLITRIDDYNKKSNYLICYLEKGYFEAQPAWIVVTNWGMPGESLTHIQNFIFNNDGQIVYFNTCK